MSPIRLSPVTAPAGVEIGKINSALADGKLTRTERARLALELRKSIDRQTRAIRALEK